MYVLPRVYTKEHTLLLFEHCLQTSKEKFKEAFVFSNDEVRKSRRIYREAAKLFYLDTTLLKIID